MKRALQYIIPIAIGLLWGATFFFETAGAKITWVTLNGAVTAILTLLYQVRRDDREIAAVEAAKVRAYDDDLLLEILVRVGTSSLSDLFDREVKEKGLTQERAEKLLVRASLEDRQRFSFDAARAEINGLRARYEWRQKSGTL
jgi:hypothetical protein